MIDPRGGALYRQIADHLRGLILAGEYPPGSYLPAEPDLAVTYEVGRRTIRDAFAILRAEGLVITRRGFRAQVREQPPRQVVPVPPGVRVSARMPTSDEQRDMRIPAGVPLLVVGSELYPAHEYEIETRGTSRDRRKPDR